MRRILSTGFCDQGVGWCDCNGVFHGEGGGNLRRRDSWAPYQRLRPFSRISHDWTRISKQEKQDNVKVIHENNPSASRIAIQGVTSCKGILGIRLRGKEFCVAPLAFLAIHLFVECFLVPGESYQAPGA